MAFGLNTLASAVARAKRFTRRRQRPSSSRSAASKEEIDNLRSTAGSSFCCVTPTSSKVLSRSSSGMSTLLDSPSSGMQSPASHNQRLQGWMYWARYDDAPELPRSDTSYDNTRCASSVKHQTVIKVYAVLRNEFLLLYRDNRKSSRHNAAPLIQIAVDRAGRSIDGAFHVFDPHGEEMELHLYDRSDIESAERWALALELAAELTHAYFASFDVKVANLSRSSMYRGTLHDFRAQQRPSVHEKLRASFAPLRSSSSRMFGRCSTMLVSTRCE